MHIAYSALQFITPQTNSQLHNTDHELLLRYQAYISTCNKYSNEIAAIQKYIPGWNPLFKY